MIRLMLMYVSSFCFCCVVSVWLICFCVWCGWVCLVSGFLCLFRLVGVCSLICFMFIWLISIC